MNARRFFSAMTVAVMTVGCRKPPSPDARPLNFEFAGCAAVRNDKTCILDDSRRLTLFVTREVEVDAEVEENVAVPGGRRVRVKIGPTQTGLHLRREGERGALTLGPPPARSPQYVAARKLATTDVDAALRALASAEFVAPEEKAAILGLTARLELVRGRVDAAIAAFRAAIDEDRRTGRLSDEIDDAFALSYTLHQRGHRYAEARAVLDDAGRRTTEYPEGSARLPYYRAILASELGDRRASLRGLDEAAERARRLGMQRLVSAIDTARALEFLHLGRPRDAWDTLSALDKDADTPSCQRIEHLINMGFAARALEGQRDAPDAIAILSKAASETGCADRSRRASALGNLAEVAIARGDVATAKRSLNDAKTLAEAPRLLERLAWIDVEGSIALAENAPRAAVVSFDRELALARASSLLDAEWRAQVGRGKALSILGRREDALEAFADAERMLDGQSLTVPLGEGRSDYLHSRSPSLEWLVDGYVAAGRAREALRAVTHAETRLLLSVSREAAVSRLEGASRDRWDSAIAEYREARAALDRESSDDWKYPRSELATRLEARKTKRTDVQRALDAALAAFGAGLRDEAAALPGGEGIATLVWQNTPHGLLVLIEQKGAVTAARVPRVSVDDVSMHLADVARLRLFPNALLEGVDVASLPFRDGMVIDRFIVDYALPLAARDAPVRRNAALVVADPLNDLAESRKEAAVVVERLAARGLEVRSLLGHEARADVLRSSLDVAFFHYAGHGHYAGHDGWESSLPLAEQTHLAMGDILTLPSAPERVVLSGCETAVTRDGGLGLASAFLVSGSREVVGPTRRVSDRAAAAMSRALYASLGDRDLASALTDAMRQYRREDEHGEWAAFRAFRR